MNMMRRSPGPCRIELSSMPTTFEPGSSLAHYRVIAPLGAGGMGEVYKAHDLTLDRTVALKILPPELVRNDERVRRFIQEARSASSLNHPHIVTIHEIGQTESTSSNGEGVHYIAMELIDGSTLKKKIHADETDLRTLLVYLAQTAEGLAKAHAAGIIHRDLKPENIMVTRDGYAKVLDFGLAKLNVKKSVEASTDPTALRDNTREGTLLGTVGYMSPEQVQGKVVDQRSDIFSFGCILYEAATRRRPFEADSDIDIMHKIMHDKPVAIDEINPAVPADLRRVIRRCLTKDPDKRFQSMKDVSLELTDIVDQFEELSASASSGSRSVSNEALVPASTRRAFWPAMVAAGIVVVAAVTFGIYQMRQAGTPDRAPVPFESMQLTRLTSSGKVTWAAIAPDGKYVAQVLIDDAGHFSMSVRQVATGSDVQVIAPSPLPFSFVTFSPDGNYIYYSQYDSASGTGYGTLFQVPTLGGPPRKLAFDVDTHVTFSPDGKQMAFVRGNPQVGQNDLMVTGSDGTGERLLLKYQRLGAPFSPAWSPDGMKILMPVRSLEGGLHGEFNEIDVASGKAQTIGGRRWADAGQAAWLPDGSGIVMVAAAGISDRPQVWRQPYPSGEPVRVTNDLNEYQGVSITADGKTLSTVQVDQKNTLMLMDTTDETGGRLFTDRMTGARPWQLAAAATGAVVVGADNDDGINVAIIDGPGAVPRRLTSDGVSGSPTIASDGKTIAFHSLRTDNLPKIFVMDSDGSNVRQIAEGRMPQISPDGRYVVYSMADSSLWRAAVAGGKPMKLAERTNFSYAVSPDSARVAYTFRKLVQKQHLMYLAVIPLSGGPLTVDIPLTASGVIRWDPREESIDFLRPSDGGDNVFAQSLAGGSPRKLTRLRKGEISSFDWTADRKLIMTRGEIRSDVVLIKNFQ